METPLSSLGRQLDRLAYHVQQWSLRAPLAALRRVTLALSPHYVAKVFVARKPLEDSIP